MRDLIESKLNKISRNLDEGAIGSLDFVTKIDKSFASKLEFYIFALKYSQYPNLYIQTDLNFLKNKEMIVNENVVTYLMTENGVAPDVESDKDEIKKWLSENEWICIRKYLFDPDWEGYDNALWGFIFIASSPELITKTKKFLDSQLKSKDYVTMLDYINNPDKYANQDKYHPWS